MAGPRPPTSSWASSLPPARWRAASSRSSSGGSAVLATTTSTTSSPATSRSCTGPWALTCRGGIKSSRPSAWWRPRTSPTSTGCPSSSSTASAAIPIASGASPTPGRRSDTSRRTIARSISPTRSPPSRRPRRGSEERAPMPTFNFDLCELPPAAQSLRAEVREFLREALGGASSSKRALSWGGFDREFSRQLGARGWIGMMWPKKYGGHERTALERYVVLEECLSAGAPVSAHWVADRQSGPLLLRFGTEEQRQRFLPRIARGELAFAIGMSEPDSGSDLASIRTRAERVPGGYCVNGTKVWTSNAHLFDYMIALFRTHHDPAKKHEGLTQFLVDTKLPGMTINPIIDLAGSHHFNMVVFEDAFVPEEMRVGEEDAGWKQVTTELAFERSGPERYLSSLALILELIREAGKDPGERAAGVVGRLIAHLATLRQMSLSVATMLEAGENPNLEAAVVKDVGTTFEQEVPEAVHALLGLEPTIDTGSHLQQVLGYLTQTAPSFSLRGGTREILRGIIARGLGLR